jgi:hypothetical protein
MVNNIDIYNKFTNRVMAALKSDCSDLRKEQKILKAYRASLKEMSLLKE